MKRLDTFTYPVALHKIANLKTLKAKEEYARELCTALEGWGVDPQKVS